MQLLLIRHGLPVRVEGASGGADPQLAELGEAQAARIPAAIERHRVVRVVSSPQLRARQTAAATATALDLPIDTLPGLAEYDHGDSFYIPIEQAKTDHPAAYARIKAGHLPESVDPELFLRRVLDTVDEIVASTDHLHTVAAFAHGGVVNAVLTHILGLEMKLTFPIDYCSITRILFSRSGTRTIAAVNETAHVWDLLPRNR